MLFAKPPAVRVPTGNFGYPPGQHGRNGRKVIGICYHIAQGDRAAVDSWFTSPKSLASAHFLICRDGSLIQYVDEEDAAWTQGEIAGATWPLYDPKVNPNLVLVSIEHEGYYTEPWTEAMVEADIALTLHLCERFGLPPRRPHLVGHHELNSVTRKNCPGPKLPWDVLINEVQRIYAKRTIPWMAEAISLGMATGITDGTRPLDWGLRGEAMTMFVRVLERLAIPPLGKDPGPVAPEAPDWMRPFVRKAIQYAISDGTRPTNMVTRAEAITMALRTLDRAAPWLDSVLPVAPGQSELDRAVKEQISDGKRTGEVALRGELMTMAVRLIERFLPGEWLSPAQ